MTKKTKKQIIKLAIALIIINFISKGLYTSYLTAISLNNTRINEQIAVQNAQNAPITHEIPKVDTMSIPELIEAYGGSQSVNIKKVAQCESSLRPSVVNYNDGGKGLHSYGLLQIQPPTWRDFEKWSGMKLDMHSPMDQIKMTKWAFDNGYGHRWTCYRKLVA